VPTIGAEYSAEVVGTLRFAHPTDPPQRISYVARVTGASRPSAACMLRCSCGLLARPASPQGRHRRLRPLCDKLFVQPATAVVSPPNLSAHQPAGDAASRHDDPPKMPGGWFGRTPLQSQFADVDGCESNRCHAHHLAQAACCRHCLQRASRRPLIGFHDRRPAATARNNIDSRNPFSILAIRES